ncbi:MAG: DUF4433 domain-containing protein [Candidatus Hydrogenedentes bacterium]|nr:DUF4433 domain-containing protein [Candidatus Hydrogenedentota bacterium]
MKREDIRELHYVTPIDNVTTILQLGILSHVQASPVDHLSIAMEQIQAKRANKRIPGARRLHEYVNLYFDAHNPMLSKVRAQNDTICVLRFHGGVLDLPGVIVADRNASSDYVVFRPVATGLDLLDSSRVFAQYWTHPDDPIDEMRHKSEKCAEVLVPDRVSPEFIIGAYVANPAALHRWQALGVHVTVEVRHGFFF